MCPSNNESRICDQPLVHLSESENPRITFGASCNRAMYQHIVRNRLSPSECRWKGYADLKKRMYLVRHDGSSWGPEFDQVALSRLATALQSRRRTLVHAGAVAPGAGSGKWAAWADGLLHPDWSGKANAISQDVGQALLDDLERRKIDETVPGDQEEQPDDQEHLRAMSPPPSAMLAPSVILGPDDSASVAGLPAGRRRNVPRPRTVAEIELDIVTGAWMLFAFSTSIDRLQYGHRYEDEQASGVESEIRVQRLARWELVEELIRFEKELDAAWIQEFFGADAGSLLDDGKEGHSCMPRGLVGSLWLHFLGGSEERLIIDAAEKEGVVDAESVASLSLMSLSVLEEDDDQIR